MRRIVIALAAAGLVLGAGTALAAGAQYKLRVAGLACPFCAYGIEKKLSEVRGVDEVETDIASGAVVVTMKEGESLDRAAAEAAVKAAGFTLRDIEATPP
jgi:mercuric ion binding protein